MIMMIGLAMLYIACVITVATGIHEVDNMPEYRNFNVGWWFKFWLLFFAPFIVIAAIYKTITEKD